jgi:hypothetical protein
MTKFVARHFELLGLFALLATYSGDAGAQPMEVVVPEGEFQLVLSDDIPDEMRDIGVLRSGLIRLPADIFAGPSDDPVVIPIADNRSIELVEGSRQVAGASRTYVRGTVDSDSRSQFVMQLVDNTLQRGEIRIANEVINLTAPQPANSDLIFRFLVFDSAVVPDERDALDPNISESNSSAINAQPDEPIDAQSDDSGNDLGGDDPPDPVPVAGAAPVEVKLMVAFTPAAKVLAESIWLVPIEETIIWTVDLANYGFEDQGGVTFDLVHTELVPYVESNDIGIDIDRLACPCDHKIDSVGSNHLNEVFDPWKTNDADIVSLWIASPGQQDAGIAYTMPQLSTNFAPFAVNVVDVWAAVVNYSFEHEIGHNFGARHDRAQSTIFGAPYNFNHGWVNLSAQQVTMMAYTKTCDSFGYDCVRVPIWSDPDYPTAGDWGIASGPFAADNARTLSTSAPTVADFNTKKNLVGCCINTGNWLYKKWRPGACP